MNEYNFKYQNSKGGLHFLSGILVPFLLLLPSIFLLDYVPWIFWISVPLTIFLIVYCFREFHKKSNGNDTITVDNDGFTSKDYGRVRFSDIHSIPPYGALQAPPPSMRIRLHNGKKLVWQFNPDNPKAKDDVLTFTAFREVLLEHLKRQTQTEAPEYPVRRTNGAEAMADSTTPQAPEKAPVAATEVIQQLERHKKRDINYKYVTIPFGFALAVLMFVRTCGEDMIREQKNKEFEGVRNTILSMETDYEDNVQEAIRTAKTYARKFGPVFLFTNDPRGKVEFIPDIPKDPFAPEINVVGIRRVEENKKLEAFIEHPDSVNYLLAVFNPSIGFSAIMQESIFSEADSTAAVVYFAVYNPAESLPPNYRYSSDTTFHPIQYTTSINIPIKGKLTKEVFENMDFASVRAILHEYKGTHFYMAVKAQDGIPPERFEELKKLVSTNFEAHGIHADQFQSMRFNE